tara:strand:- start:3124 stop:4002 length:879 start_codon:yes stop_codon:yes gene_type:complete
MNVLSLFDGMSCAQIALERLGIKVDNYYASEIDKYAIKVAQKNYPNTKQVGNIIELKGDRLPNIDLLCGGSPCQSFSRSGNQSGFNGKSKLFWEYVRLLKEVNPKYFLLENVVMKKEWENIISDALGVESIQICSSKFSAQKRQRLYWTNIPQNLDIVDKGITLKDIVIGERDQINSPLIMDNYDNGSYKIRNCTLKGYLIAEEGDGIALEYPKSNTRRGRVSVGKTNTLNTACNIGMIKDGKLVKLNINDCEALQTLPKDYTSSVSDNQRKKMIGNGWTIDVIAHLFKNLK